MGDVEGYRDELNTFVSQWDLLTILGQMAGTDWDMTSTRKEFQRLTNDLLGHLGMETLKKAVQEISAVAQVSVDILILNLFERTADIGFLVSEALGVLCLCFRFENEKVIFANLISEDDWSIITILDNDGRVIASSDP